MNHSQVFTSSGTFNVPAGVSCVLVTMIAGGGAGTWANSFVVGLYGGGAGGFCYRRPCVVTPEGTVTVTIGAGGISTDGVIGFTGNGGDTSFGSLGVTGGQGAFWSDAGHPYGGVGGNAAGLAYEAGVSDPSLPPPHVAHGVLLPDPGFLSTQNTYGWFGGSSGGTGGGGGGTGNPGHKGGDSGNGFTGGLGGASGGFDGSSGGGGGGASPWGNGGAGALRTSASAQNGGSASASHYGAGGGGAIGTPTVGGSGAPGYCLVEWYELL